MEVLKPSTSAVGLDLGISHSGVALISGELRRARGTVRRKLQQHWLLDGPASMEQSERSEKVMQPASDFVKYHWISMDITTTSGIIV